MTTPESFSLADPRGGALVVVDPDAAHDPLIGSVLGGRYLIERKLGRGATGAVYRASHVKFGRAFAIKVLHADRTRDAKLLRRFDREAELSGKVTHPNLVSVIDVGETADGTRYMVQELAIGIDLGTVIADEAPLEAARVIHLLKALCDGLFHAHERGLIHRDLKPENIIIERDDHFSEVPRIVDFGIALARDEAADPTSTDRLTTNGLVLGTPQYMAPEQATGFALDHRIDLFALGVFTFEMLTGVAPFEGSGVEVARANILYPMPAMAVRAPGVAIDPLLEAFAQRLMDRAPERRPPTAHAARVLLELIERDRAAAAVELGVVLAAAPVAAVAAAPAAPVVAAPIVELPAEGIRPRAPTAPVRRSRRRLAVIVGAYALAGGALWIVASSLLGSPPPPAPAPIVVPMIAMAAPIDDAFVAPVADAAAPELVVAPVGPAGPAAPALPPPRPHAPPRPPPPPPPAGAPTAQDVASLYTAVGRELRHVGVNHEPDATEALSIRFRRIRLADAMATDAARRDALVQLAAIRHDIADLDKAR